MQVSVAAPHEVLNGGAGAPTAQPTYVLAGAPPQAVGQDLVKTEPGQEPQTFTIRSIDPSIQHQQNIVYSIQPQFAHQQPITVKTEAGVISAGALSPPEHVTVAGGLPTTPVSSATPKTPKTMSAKKGNKKNVWVPGKPLTPKAREMMESGKGSMNQDGRWTCVECNRSLSNEWTLEQHIQTVHGERIFNCKSCNKAFKRRDHLLNHIKTIHKGLKPCKKCNVVFVNKEELRAHKMAVHLKLAPEDTAPPPLAKNTAQEVLQYMEEETPASTPAHRAAHAQAQQQQQTTQLTTQPAAAQQPVQVRSNNVVASYDNLLEGFSIPQGPGGQQVVVTINPQHLAQAGVATQPNGATAAQPTTQPPGHTVSQPAAQTVTYQTQQPISVVPVQMGQLQGGQQVTYITAPPTAGQPTAIPVNLANGTQVLQAPQVLEMNPSYAAQNGTTVNGSPVKPTITYSGSDSGTVTTTPSRVKTPVPAASVSSPSPPPLLVQPPPQQQQQLQAVLTAASTPQAPQQLFQTASSNNNVSFRKVMTIPDSLKCDVLGCERSFKTVQEYTAHRQWLHEPVQCPLCKMFFAGERSLKAHMKAHEGPNGLYKCHLCPGTFRDKATLQAHVDVFHTEYTCLECGSVFQGSEQAMDHIAEMHAPVKILDPIDAPENVENGNGNAEGCNYQCSACFLAFAKRSDAEKHFVECHMTTETEKVFHCCPYCKEVFLSYVRLDDHMRWEHSLEEIDENFVIDDFKEQVFFECDGRFFHDEKDLQQHIRSRLTAGLNSCRQPLKALGTNQANNKQLNNSQQQQPQKLVKNAVESILGTSVGTTAPSLVVDQNQHGVPVVTSLGSMGSTLHLPEAVAAPVVHSVVGGTGDELAKAVESILGTSGDVDMDDINKMAAGAVISGAIDPDDANVVIEDSGVIVETDAAVSALLGQQQPIKMHNGALPVVHQTVVNGFPVSMEDDSDSDDSDEDEEDFEPKPIPIQPPQMKAAALINGIKAVNGPI